MSAPKTSSTARPGFFRLELLDNRYPALHGLRVLAILGVIQIHVTWDFHNVPVLDLPRWFIDRSYAVFFGMDGFFFLSGFLIGSILLRSIDTSGTQQLRRFYLRRIFRTFPSYYIVLTLLALCFRTTPSQRAQLWYEYVYLTNFAVMTRNRLVMLWGWSLSLEEQFYLSVPLLFVVLRWLKSDRARIALLAVLTLSALFVRLGIYYHTKNWPGGTLFESIYFRTYTRYDAILAGVLLAFVEARYRDRMAAWLQHPAHRAALAVPALGCLWILLAPDIIFGEENLQLVHVFCWGTITSVMYLCAVPLLLHGQSMIVRWLSFPIWRELATVGYGVYLVHIPILDHVMVPLAARLFRMNVALPVLWLSTLVATVILAFAAGYVMHILIEKPSLRVRDWLAR